MKLEMRTNAAAQMALFLLFATAPAAFAADAVTETEPQPYVDETIVSRDWVGAYFGLYGGYDWLKADFSAVPAVADLKGVNGLKGGAYLGYNYQIDPNWVAGVEGLAGLGGGNDSFSGASLEKKWEGALRGRLGWSPDQNSLFYGLAGLTGGGFDASSPTGSDTQTMLGWQIGAGLETFLTENLIGRVEYDYSDYGSETFNLGGTATEISPSGHSIKLGVGFKF